MVNPLTVYADDGCFLVRKIKAIAHETGVQITQKPASSYPQEYGTAYAFDVQPALMTHVGLIAGSDAAVRFLANAHPVCSLYGRTLAERARVDSQLGAVLSNLESPIIAFVKGADAKTVSASLEAAISKMDAKLQEDTWLVNDTFGIVDITAASAVAGALTKQILAASALSAYPHFARMFNTLSQRYNWEHKISVAAMEAAPAAPARRKSDDGAKSKEDTAKKQKDELAAKALNEAPVKEVDPMDELPPTNFDMESWKRYYSNCKDLRGDAMKWLWEHHDPEGFSFWHLHYQRFSETENTQAFKASNLLGMFIQRIHNKVRRYSFAVCNIFKVEGDTPFYDIQGVMLTRSHEIPPLLKEHDQFDSFTWRKLDHIKDKALIEDYFCEGDAIDGRVIADCKVYK